MPRSANDVLRPEIGTPPPKRSRGSRNQFVVFLNFLVTTIFFVAIAAVVAAYFGKRSFEAPGPAATASVVQIKEGTGTQEIANQLERRGLISDARVFLIGTRAFGGRSLKAGEYEIKAHASMRDIMNVLQSGRSILYSLTIPEGLTVEQALEHIRDHEALSGEMPAEMPMEGSSPPTPSASPAVPRASRSSRNCSPTRKPWSRRYGHGARMICRLQASTNS